MRKFEMKLQVEGRLIGKLTLELFYTFQSHSTNNSYEIVTVFTRFIFKNIFHRNVGVLFVFSQNICKKILIQAHHLSLVYPNRLRWNPAKTSIVQN